MAITVIFKKMKNVSILHVKTKGIRGIHIK